MKKYLGMLFCVALIVFFTTPLAFGQALDGLWFQAKVSIKGYTVDSSGALDKISGSAVNYLYLTWNVSETNYAVTVYDEAGNVQPISENTFQAIGDNEDIVSDLGLVFGEGSNYLRTYQTSLIKIKRESKTPAIKSVTFNSLGCEVFYGYIDGKDFFGGCTMKAKMIDSPPFPI